MIHPLLQLATESNLHHAPKDIGERLLDTMVHWEVSAESATHIGISPWIPRGSLQSRTSESCDLVLHYHSGWCRVSENESNGRANLLGYSTSVALDASMG